LKIESFKYKRRFVIGDIHGCNKTLKRLIKIINFQKDDILFFLGDYINKGIDSYGVIEFLLNLKNNNYQVFFVRGNHEQEFLENISKDDPISNFYYAKEYNCQNLFTIDGFVKSEVVDFLNQTEFYFEIEDYFLVHAGFNFNSLHFLDDINSMLYIRNWKIDEEKLKGKNVIFGHQPTELSKIFSAIKNRKNKIPLDNGCVYRYRNFNKNNQLGRLCCLELNSNWLYFIQNIDEVRQFAK